MVLTVLPATATPDAAAHDLPATAVIVLGATITATAAAIASVMIGTEAATGNSVDMEDVKIVATVETGVVVAEGTGTTVVADTTTAVVGTRPRETIKMCSRSGGEAQPPRRKRGSRRPT